MKFHYFNMHGRGIMNKFVLMYARGCMWEDCCMTKEEFMKAKECGMLPYG